VIAKGDQAYTNASLKFIFSPNGELLASGSMDYQVKLWDFQTGQCQHTLTGHSKWILGLSFSPNSRYLASSCEDSEIKLWQVDTGTCCRTFRGHTNWVWAIAFLPDGQTLVSGGDDGTCAFGIFIPETVVLIGKPTITGFVPLLSVTMVAP
jgi:WD40 repeat protein